MKYLFLDDERNPHNVTWVRIPMVHWNIVRSCDEAISWVLTNGFPDFVSFDHDLAEGHYSGDFSKGKTGYDFAKWLIEYDMKANLMPVDFAFTVHSMNPIGAKNIRLYLENYIRQKGIA